MVCYKKLMHTTRENSEHYVMLYMINNFGNFWSDWTTIKNDIWCHEIKFT